VACKNLGSQNGTAGGVMAVPHWMQERQLAEARTNHLRAMVLGLLLATPVWGGVLLLAVMILR
jgi:hypothetical protein